MLPISDILRELSSGEKSVLAKSQPTRFLENNKPVVVWNINRKCNMTCPHCYAGAKLNPAFDGVSSKQAMDIIEKMADFGITMLIISGGEPLMRDDVYNIISHASKRGMSCAISSNGTLITSEVATRLKETGVYYVGISIDGMETFNDAYRGLEGGFNQALNGATACLEAGLKVGIRITVSKQNRDQVFPLLDLTKRIGAHRFYLSHLVYGGRGKSYSRYDLAHKETENLIKTLFEESYNMVKDKDKLSIVTGGNDADGVMLYFFIRDKLGDDKAKMCHKILEMRGGNSAGEKIINIDHKGDVFPDQFWREESLGNICNQPLEEILQHPLIAQLKDREEMLKGKCSKCSFLSICRGSHRERALAEYGDIWAEDPSCYITEVCF